LIIGARLRLTGAGGSVFAVPLLVLFLGLEPQVAMGRALGALAASAAYGSFMQREQIMWLPSFIFILGGVLAAPFGKWLAEYIPGFYLLCGFAAVSFAISIKMYVDAVRHPEYSNATRARLDATITDASYICRFGENQKFELKPKCITGLVFVGLLTGFASGLFGVGGGFLVVPILLYLGQIHINRAIASSLFIILFISGSGFISYLVFDGLSNGVLLAWLLLMALVGMFFSRFFASRLAGPKLQKIFSLTLALVSFVSVVNYLIQ